MTVEIQINCKECLGDRHETCLNENCLCRNDNHGIKEKDLTDTINDFSEKLSKHTKKHPDVWKNIYDSQRQVELDFEGKERIDNVSNELQKQYSFLTLRKTEKILLYNGKIYDSLHAETIIKEETEKLIPNCPAHDTREVVEKIKRQTYSNIEDFDKDPNLITVENGI